MKRGGVGCLLLSSWALAANAEPIEIKGVTLGSTTEAEVAQLFPGITCQPLNTAFGDRQCTASRTTYGGADSLIRYTFIGDRVESALVIFSGRDYDAVINAMIERFGRPHAVETTPLGVLTNWKVDDPIAEIRAIKSSSRDSSSVHFSTAIAMREFARRTKDTQKKRASDL